MKSVFARNVERRGLCRAPQGARGLKSILARGASTLLRRAPQGARGLKFFLPAVICEVVAVAPRKGRVG